MLINCKGLYLLLAPLHYIATQIIDRKKGCRLQSQGMEKDSANDASFTLLLKLTFNENVPMKKILAAHLHYSSA
jgi:hypothetical protein